MESYHVHYLELSGTSTLQCESIRRPAAMYTLIWSRDRLARGEKPFKAYLEVILVTKVRLLTGRQLPYTS